jgi:hypothetical protein
MNYVGSSKPTPFPASKEEPLSLTLSPQAGKGNQRVGCPEGCAQFWQSIPAIFTTSVFRGDILQDKRRDTTTGFFEVSLLGNRILQGFTAWLNQFVANQNDNASVQHDIAALQEAGMNSYETLLQIADDLQADPNIRALACWLLGKTKRSESLPTLRRACQSPTLTVRVAALQALRGYSPDEQLSSITIDVLLYDSSQEARRAAAYALAAVGTESALPILIAVLQDSAHSPAVRGMVAETLSNFAYPSVVESLITSLDDPEVEVRFWATYALGEIGDPQALPKLRQLALDDVGVLANWGTIKQEARQAIDSIMQHRA